MNSLVHTTVVPLLYLVAATLFIVSLKQLGRVRTARRGNTMASLAMLIAVVATLIMIGRVDYRWIAGGVAVGSLIGVVAAVRVPMTGMPEMVALFNGFGGAASMLVALSQLWLKIVEPALRDDQSAGGLVGRSMGGPAAVMVGLSVLIGALTLSGSLIAFLKLQGTLRKGKPVLLPGRHAINGLLGLGAIGLTVYLGFGAQTSETVVQSAVALSIVALALGVLLVIPIGGADMPVVVSLLNSYSGMAASAAGFVIGNQLLVIAGALVGSAGIILTQIMCVAMNRSLLNVLVGGFGTDAGSASDNGPTEYVGVKSTSAEEAAMLLENASSVIVVPGYGLAVAQAQHAVRELADVLEKRGVEVRYAIHPVAGRMPGHMNVLLAEADIAYEKLVEMDSINGEFRNTDVTIVLGANDVVNPAAAQDASSPIYGMPILNAHESRTVFVVKRSLGAGYAGIKNTLFENENTMMVFGDAKQVVQGLVSEVKSLAA